MNDSQLSSIVEVKRFLQESDVIEFKKRFRKEAYQWIEEALEKFDYLYLPKKEKGLIKKYIEKVTGYSRPQVTLKVKQNSRVKAGLFSIVVKQKILELISSLLESFCPETGSIDLDDRRIMHHTIQYGRS